MEILFEILFIIITALLISMVIIDTVFVGKDIKKEKKFDKINMILGITTIVLSLILMALAVYLKKYYVIIAFWIVPAGLILKLIGMRMINK